MMSNSPGLYVHTPFCPSKCPYCDFYSITALSMAPEWAKSLLREARLWKEKEPSVQAGFDTFYFGGGTPSCLPEKILAGLIYDLTEIVTPEIGAEITVEINPEDARPEKIRSILDAGANRLSLGVQSLDDDRLRLLGRRHDAAQARRAIDTCRDAGCENLGLDLMYGLPGQTIDQWIETLDAVSEISPEHLSCYQLTVEPGSRFADLVSKGAITLPDEDLSARFFLVTSEYLTDRGYDHYEISNFALPGYRSRHNMKYWSHAPYLGLGPAAHSFRHGQRWWNVRSVKTYIRTLSDSRLPIKETEALTSGQMLLETIYLGLRTRGGVTISDLCLGSEGERLVHAWLERGWAALTDNCLALTTAGWVVADRLTVDLAAAVVPEPEITAASDLDRLNPVETSNRDLPNSMRE